MSAQKPAIKARIIEELFDQDDKDMLSQAWRDPKTASSGQMICPVFFPSHDPDDGEMEYGGMERALANYKQEFTTLTIRDLLLNDHFSKSEVARFEKSTDVATNALLHKLEGYEIPRRSSSPAFTPSVWFMTPFGIISILEDIMILQRIGEYFRKPWTQEDLDKAVQIYIRKPETSHDLIEMTSENSPLVEILRLAKHVLTIDDAILEFPLEVISD